MESNLWENSQSLRLENSKNLLQEVSRIEMNETDKEALKISRVLRILENQGNVSSKII